MLYTKEPLYNDVYWHKLLHFKSGESQIDDDSFFLSSNGKFSAKDEMEATLKAIEESDPKDINGTQCRYPARIRWLRENLPNREIKECRYLADNLKKFDFKSLYLVYTSSFMNSPASMVGHTFLRFDKDDKTPLLSYALNYSARIDKNSTIFSYAYNGIIGGFEGRYAIVPYYKMVKLYSDMEHRDMWEYKLDLTPKEIERVVLHMFEMQPFYSDYLFFNENCAYNLLWFIELARDDLRLVDKFDYITAPLDTIKELKRVGLIRESIFRASKSTKIESIYHKIENKQIALKFLDRANLNIIKRLSQDEQHRILSLYFLKSKDDNISDILLYRSGLGQEKKDKIESTTNPLKSNRATKTALSYLNGELEIGMRVAYHDIYDVDYDFNEGSYISFFDIKATERRLNSLTLVDIDSLAKQDELYKPYSWGISFGLNRDRNDILEAELKLKGGKSFDFFDAMLSFEPTLGVRYRGETRLLLGYDISLMKSFENFKLGVLSSQSYGLKRETISKREAFVTYQILDNMALSFSILELGKRRTKRVGLFLYF